MHKQNDVAIVSLLRYIAAQKNSQGEPYYGSVVIVAHSLGALISADLLHFLKEEPDEALRPARLWREKAGDRQN